MPNLHEIALWLVVSIIAITFHEAAHGWVAYKRGDDTAKRLGRVTFNPIAHIDTFGTLILPLLMKLSGLPFIFGWAKPVPVNFARLKNPRIDSVLVALAGPGINLVLAVLCVAGLRWVAGMDEPPQLAVELLFFGVILNLVFAIFNLLPIPPLDGSRVLAAVLPARFAIYLARIEPYGLAIVLGGLLVLPWVLQSIGIPFNPLGFLLVEPVRAVANLLSNWLGMPDLL